MSDNRADRKAAARTQFNATAAGYDSGPGVFAHFGRRLVAAADIAPGSRILDVASGRGAVLFPAAEKVGATGHAIGVDFSEEMVRASKDEAGRLGLHAQIEIMDAEHLEFPNASFDRVLCGFGIMFFPDQAQALGEFRRVLRPGGRLALSTWRVHQASEVEAALSAAGITPQRAPGWITESEDLTRLITSAGFTGVQVHTDTFSFHYGSVEEYWQQARGTGMRRMLDNLDSVQTERIRSALAERMQHHQQPDGFRVSATALLAVGAP